jgi:hypothetical protein
MRQMVRPDVDPETAGDVALPAIHLQVEERLRQSAYRALRDVSCLARDGVIYLHGCLPSYHLKQIAQELAAGAAGVRGVVNRIEVSAQSGRARPGLGTRPTRLVDRGQAKTSIGGGGSSSLETRPTRGVRNNVGPKPQAE